MARALGAEVNTRSASRFLMRVTVVHVIVKKKNAVAGESATAFKSDCVFSSSQACPASAAACIFIARRVNSARRYSTVRREQPSVSATFD